MIVETTNEVLAALKELAEMTTSSIDKLSFMQQASCLADSNRPALLGDDLGYLEYLKWMLSYSWNLGVQAYQRDQDRDLAKRLFQFSTHLLS